MSGILAHLSGAKEMTMIKRQRSNVMAWAVWMLILIPGWARIQADEWGPFSGGGTVGGGGGSTSASVFGSYEYNYDSPGNSATPALAAVDLETQGLAKASPRNGVDVELSLLEFDKQAATKEKTEVLSMSYVRVFKLERSRIRFRLGGGLSYFNLDETEVGPHLKLEMQIPLRFEGNVGLMLGVVHYQANSDLDATVFRAGIRLHRRQRK